MWLAQQHSQAGHVSIQVMPASIIAASTLREALASAFSLTELRILLVDLGVNPDSVQWCMFSESIRNEDSGNALIEFENGVRAMGQIDVDENYDLKIGMTLRPTWAPVRVQYGEDVYGLKLEPMV